MDAGETKWDRLPPDEPRISEGVRGAGIGGWGGGVNVYQFPAPKAAATPQFGGKRTNLLLLRQLIGSLGLTSQQNLKHAHIIDLGCYGVHKVAPQSLPPFSANHSFDKRALACFANTGYER